MGRTAGTVGAGLEARARRGRHGGGAVARWSRSQPRRTSSGSEGRAPWTWTRSSSLVLFARWPASRPRSSIVAWDAEVVRRPWSCWRGPMRPRCWSVPAGSVAGAAVPGAAGITGGGAADGVDGCAVAASGSVACGRGRERSRVRRSSRTRWSHRGRSRCAAAPVPAAVRVAVAGTVSTTWTSMVALPVTRSVRALPRACSMLVQVPAATRSWARRSMAAQAVAASSLGKVPCHSSTPGSATQRRSPVCGAGRLGAFADQVGGDAREQHPGAAAQGGCVVTQVVARARRRWRRRRRRVRLRARTRPPTAR